MNVTVLKPGLLTTVQDRGRRGHAALGVGVAGPMDDAAFQLANALVGNDSDAAALELTLIGPRLRFDSAATIALTGAAFAAQIDGEPIDGWRAIEIHAGAVLDCGRARRGARGYLAIVGGFAVEHLLGSAATDIKARLGPFRGRALCERDTLGIHVGAPEGAMLSRYMQKASRLPALLPNTRRESDLPRAHVGAPEGTMLSRYTRKASRLPALLPSTVPTAWSLDPRPWFDSDPERSIRLIRGSHFDALDHASREALFAEQFRIAADSNRVGFRLDGPRLAFTEPLELVSEPVSFGTVQLPPGGQPIALMAEHPTTGGYPRIGQIAAIDLPRLAQRRPGDPLRFTEIGLDDAQTRYLRHERELACLVEAIAARRQAGS